MKRFAAGFVTGAAAMTVWAMWAEMWQRIAHELYDGPMRR